MKVYGKCKKCKNEIGYSISVNTRVEFAMQDGENKILNCKNCGMNTEIHVDELYAKKSKLAQIIAGLIFFIGTPLTLLFVYPVLSESSNHYVIYMVSGFLLVPVMVYGIIIKKEQNRVSSFNRRKLKGRVHNIG